MAKQTDTIDALKKEIATLTEIKDRRNKENIELRRELKDARHEEDTAEKIREEIWRIAGHNPTPPTWITGEGGKIGSRGCPITVWSDWHYGEVVDPAQVNRVNKYNMDIGRKRAYRLFDTTVDLAFNHMGRARDRVPRHHRLPRRRYGRWRHP